MIVIIFFFAATAIQPEILSSFNVIFLLACLLSFFLSYLLMLLASKDALIEWFVSFIPINKRQ